MFGWQRKSLYRHDVLYLLGTLLTDDSGTFRRTLLRSYPGIEVAIKSGYEENQNKDELAATLAQIVLADAIAQSDDEDRKKSIAVRLSAWVARSGQSHFRQELAGYRSDEIDGLELRLRAALTSISEMQEEKRLPEDAFERFFDDILGALHGLSADQRLRRRLTNVFENSKPILSAGDEDMTPFMAIYYEIDGLIEHSGTQLEVDICCTPQGKMLRRRDNGEFITERRKINQGTLNALPPDAEKYRFVNFKSRFGEIYSCVIVEPESQVFGHMRAFWWALAQVTVQTTELEVHSRRMTQMAFAQVCGYARGMWEAAVRESSIDLMRDQILPMRNMHFEVIQGQIQNATNECAKLGLKVALAMVLAVQSEDEKLERFAYRNFKKFLWTEGEEPEEFWVHES
ncbi:hypothetical protein [Rhodomicrobium lacus]|uniref:hypothetical protein n=1 Tax=Rhodomicrobium lacus TaxID=2498452 RepID=UPI0026E3E544|nr:hypothetical protein [Rhodomicrobium lacus]WKW51226.1 hypothetical protein QMO75_01640 [Rhodomicrobium lacus]